MNKRFTAIFFLIVIMFFMGDALFSFSAKKIKDMYALSEPKISSSANIDWEALYPFSGDDYPAERDHKGKKFTLSTLYDYAKRRLKGYTSDALKGYDRIRKISEYYELLISWNMNLAFMQRDILKLDGGYLTLLTKQRDITHNAEATIKFAEFCREQGIDFFYFSAPSKVCASDDKIFSGTLDFVNINLDNFLDAIGRGGVKYYDLRKMLHEEGLNHHELFFATDLHWLPDAGLWAARHLSEILRDDYNWNTDPEAITPERFEKVIINKNYYSSYASKVSLIRSRTEDFALFYPKYPVKIHYEIPSISLNKDGDFSVMYNMPVTYLYGIYNYSIKPLGIIRNLTLPEENDKKLLIIHDSFANSSIPFLAMGVKNIDEIDPRSFTGSLKSYIRQTKPDAVILYYFANVAGLGLETDTDDEKTFFAFH